VYFGHKKKKHAINNHEAKMENHIAFHHIYFIACDYPKYNQLPPCDAKKRPNFNNSTGNPNQKIIYGFCHGNRLPLLFAIPVFIS